MNKKAQEEGKMALFLRIIIWIFLALLLMFGLYKLIIFLTS